MPALTSITRASMKERGRPTIRKFYEAASQTFAAGDLVGVDSSGYVNLVVAAGSPYQSNTGTYQILGRAVSAGHNTTAGTAECDVKCFGEGDYEIAMPITASNTAGSNATTSKALMNGLLLNVLNDATYGWMASTATTTNGTFLVTEIDKSEPVGATCGFVWGHFPTVAKANALRFDN